MTETPNITLLWTDIETTGLDFDNDMILELAWQFTNYLGEPYTELKSKVTIDYGDGDLAADVLARYHAADPFVKQMHLDNGLWNEVFFRPDIERANIFECVEILLEDLDDVRGSSEVRLAGSTVHFDKRFLEQMLGETLPISHRVHDLSTIRPLMKWQGIDLDSFNTEAPDTHRAADDVARDIQQWVGLVSALETPIL